MNWVCPIRNRVEIRMFNKIIDFLVNKNYGVQRCDLTDFEKRVVLFSSILWNIDPHQNKFKSRSIHISEFVAKTFFNFNVPKDHKHKIEQLDPKGLQSDINSLSDHCLREYMSVQRMSGLKSIITEICEKVQLYIDYLKTQSVRNEIVRNKCEPEEPKIDEFCSLRLKVNVSANDFVHGTFRKLNDALVETGMYTAVVINDHLDGTNRHLFNKNIQKLKIEGFPFHSEGDVHMYTLPSTGPHHAIHFIWKQPIGSGNDAESNKLVCGLREKKKNIYTRLTRKFLKEALKKIGVTKGHNANYIIKDLLGDEAALKDESDEKSLEKVRSLVELAEDVVCDLRINNGRPPKFDEFWDIVDGFLNDKTAVDDRRHSQQFDDGGDVLVNLAISNSYADLYRQYVAITEKKRGPMIDIPTEK